ncbi:hypothetical protein tinsulaeT_15440 [Thalassotalea insulae]|uniref:7-cyano-7-deazaguanine synthase n=1 Tax=Thalassotalea insulae TaxID=2056778 RepID=A0ABQ6GSQ8_9GAMM|nr:hypothetical protein [Thalassotalea insulae]GLX78204.1 hypothetical protein tinsulaeT_15440 [Thalassotalea insulae]
MEVTAIEQSVSEDGSINVRVKIAQKSDLQLNFQGAEQLPFLNDCVFLSLYIQSMQEGTDLTFPDKFPVSAMLVENLDKHQNIFTKWYNEHLHPIDVNVKTVTQDLEASGKVSLFSGGIDSYYTYVEKQRELSHVFLCIGMDIQLEEQKKIDLAVVQYKDFARKHNKKLLIATTNVRHVFPGAKLSTQHAALFTALVLAYGLETLYIPASHNIDELFPWGSHLLTDPLLSNGFTQVIHHGAVARTEKTAGIAENKDALDSIRICNSSEEFNCGECEKCLRTMFALAVLKKETDSLPLLQNKLQFLIKIKIYNDSQATFWQDNYQLAMKHQCFELAKYAKAIVRSYQWRQWIKQGISLLRNRA